MSRHGYVEDGDDWCEDYDCGECAYCLCRKGVDDAIKSPEGQAFLRELVPAIEGEDALCSGVLQNLNGQFCAIGAVLKRRGVPVEPEDDEDYSDLDYGEIAELAGIPEELAQEVMFENDDGISDDVRRRNYMLQWAKARLVSGGDQ